MGESRSSSEVTVMGLNHYHNPDLEITPFTGMSWSQAAWLTDFLCKDVLPAGKESPSWWGFAVCPSEKSS